MQIKVPPFAELQALQHWRTVDFISDLHLSESEHETFEAWQRYLRTTTADAVFILGDLFEVWVGDDSIRPELSQQSAALNDLNFEERCTLELQAAGKRLNLYVMHGNRDFLVGEQMVTACNATLLADPTALTFQQQRYLLTHGDMLCLADTQYLAFRDLVRQPAWQQAQLSKPLLERQALGRHMREESQKNQQNLLEYVDVDTDAVLSWLQAANAKTMIHGHTHKPADHNLGEVFKRVVMTDWDLKATPNRAEVLRLSSNGLQRIKLY